MGALVRGRVMQHQPGQRATWKGNPAHRIVQALTMQWKRGKLASDGLRKNVRKWRAVG